MMLLQNSDMNETTLTLSLSEAVTHRLLPDIEALLAPSDFSVLLNTLDEQPQATVECRQTQDVCSPLAAAIMTWLRLCDIRVWQNNTPVNVQTLTTQGLYALLMVPHAHLRLAFH